MKINQIIATSVGVGYLPRCPGTWGSLVGLALGIWLSDTNLIILTLLLTAAGLWASHTYSLETQNKDPKEVVIDEVVGMMIALIFLPKTWIFAVLAFGLFRLFDIKKPSIIGRAEQLPGGWGIMGDDILAGIATNLLLQIGHLIYLLIQTTS